MIICPACAYENEDFFMFCLNCGAELSGADAVAEEEPAAPEPAAEAAPEAQPEPEPAPPEPAPTEEAAPPAPPPEPPPPPPAPAPVTQPGASPAAAATEVGVATSTQDFLPGPDGTGDWSQRPAPEKLAAAAALAEAEAEAAPQADATQAPDAGAPRGEPRGRLVLIREDGSDGDGFDLYSGQTVIGRIEGSATFDDDEFLADRHAVFFYEGDTLYIQPLESTNGVFTRIVDQTELLSGDSFRIGQELLLFEEIREVMKTVSYEEDGTLSLGSPIGPDTWARLAQQVGPDEWGDVFLLSGDEIFLGRERGDITFPEDGYVSGSHAVIARRAGRFFLKDLGSSNGTYVRLKHTVPLHHGDLVLAGQQLFRVEP